MSKSNLINKNVVFLANPKAPKKDHIYLIGKVEMCEDAGSYNRYRIRHNAPWGGMTSAWFDSENIFVNLSDV